MVSTKRKTPLSDEVTTVLPPKAEEKEFIEEVHKLFGEEILTEAIKEMTLDRFLDGNPKVLFPAEEAYTPLVERLRRDRAAYITAEVKKVRGEKKGDTDDSTD